MNTKTTEIFDEDGYPTEETLERIEKWDWQDALGCLRFVKDCWHWDDWAVETAAKEGIEFRFATGGWSGNESLIGALQRNHMVWVLAWRMSQSGGLFVFHYLPLKEKE